MLRCTERSGVFFLFYEITDGKLIALRLPDGYHINKERKMHIQKKTPDYDSVFIVRTQESMKNLQGRSVILDVHAIDSTNKEFDVEIQRKDEGAGAKRARYNSSLLDAHILKSGDDTEDIPDSYIIFITENNVM